MNKNSYLYIFVCRFVVVLIVYYIIFVYTILQSVWQVLRVGDLFDDLNKKQRMCRLLLYNIGLLFTI